MPQFLDHPLRLLNPRFDSPLLDVLTDLEHLRRLEMKGDTPWQVFVQLKHVFHLLESLASARIEGNHTTLADFVDTKVADADPHHSEQLREVENIERAMVQVEEAIVAGAPFPEHLLRGLHQTTVDSLVREGDRDAGSYRSGMVRIAQAEHLPPEAVLVPSYMGDLVAFINRADAPKYDLMKVALAHHRFAWIHPFGNGNGRVVRLFTYALLIQYGFQVSSAGRLINPAAVFCADRNRYYAMLADADAGTDEALEHWCTYVLSGIRDELRKVMRLADYGHLSRHILLPAIAHAREREHITAQEASVLSAAVAGGVVKSGELGASMAGLTANQRTYQIKKLVDNGMLQPIARNARQYSIGFQHNLLLRGVVHALRAQGFISDAVVAG